MAPLDWGLGHTTRCIPVITALLRAQHQVFFAGNQFQQEIIQQEFPLIHQFDLEGYNISYPAHSINFRRNLLAQLPKMRRAIQNERRWLERTLKEQHFDVVISDNRYGLYNKNTRTIIITHQLAIKSGFGKMIDRVIQRMHYRLIKRFDNCWIPDTPGANNLSGELSHVKSMPEINYNYIGVLSRLRSFDVTPNQNHLFISLSGPEPQRTLLEDLLIEQLLNFEGTAVVVRGISNERNILPSTNNIIFYNQLSSQEYNVEIQKAEYVITRSGYSTLMDLAKVHAKGIVIPTPGQTEQEYLAIYSSNNKRVIACLQENFSLEESLRAASHFEWADKFEIDDSLLKNAIESL